MGWKHPNCPPQLWPWLGQGLSWTPGQWGSMQPPLGALGLAPCAQPPLHKGQAASIPFPPSTPSLFLPLHPSPCGDPLPSSVCFFGETILSHFLPGPQLATSAELFPLPPLNFPCPPSTCISHSSFNSAGAVTVWSLPHLQLWMTPLWPGASSKPWKWMAMARFLICPGAHLLFHDGAGTPQLTNAASHLFWDPPCPLPLG